MEIFDLPLLSSKLDAMNDVDSTSRLTIIDRALDLAKEHGFSKVGVSKEGIEFEACLEPSAPKPKKKKTLDPEKNEPKKIVISSPFVGYYHAPEPPILVGDSVEAGEPLGLILVLALENGIDSPLSGTIEEIFVQDGDVVDFGHPLVSILPS